MSENYGRVDPNTSIIVEAVVADADYIADLAGLWVLLPYGVGIGWEYLEGLWTGPDGQPPPQPQVPPGNYILSGWEWVERFTDAEWQWLKTRRNDGTSAGDQLDRLLDAIRWTNSIDVLSVNIDPFYAWLLAQGIPGGQSRIDELRAPRDS